MFLNISKKVMPFNFFKFRACIGSSTEPEQWGFEFLTFSGYDQHMTDYVPYDDKFFCVSLLSKWLGINILYLSEGLNCKIN